MSKRPFAAFDIDGTLFRWQLFHELVFEIKEQGYFSDEVADELDRSVAAWRAKEATWHDYESTVIKAIEEDLHRIPPGAIEHAAELVVRRSGKKLYSFTKKLLQDLKAKGYFLIALSGSQQEVVEKFAGIYGFDLCIGTLYERQGSAFTGRITRFVPGSKAKLIQDAVKAHNLAYKKSVAVGDSAGDIGMLDIVERPIAFNPADDLLETAKKNGWPIVLERKNIVYRLEKGSNGVYVLAQAGTV